MTPAIHQQAATIPMLYTREAKKRTASELLRMMLAALQATSPASRR